MSPLHHLFWRAFARGAGIGLVVVIVLAILLS